MRRGRCQSMSGHGAIEGELCGMLLSYVLELVCVDAGGGATKIIWFIGCLEL